MSDDKLRKALKRLCSYFPTDSDMTEAGWELHEITAACDAYDKARAALSEPASAPQMSVERRAAESATPAATELEVARQTVAFFASVIRSGEKWSSYCQDAYDAAMGRRT